MSIENYDSVYASVEAGTMPEPAVFLSGMVDMALLLLIASSPALVLIGLCWWLVAKHS